MIENFVERIIPKSREGNIFVQIFSIFVVSLGGFSVGAQFAWPSPSIPQLMLNSSYIGQITMEKGSYFAIITPIFMIISSFLVGNAMNYFGRKSIIRFMAIPHIASWILIALARDIVPIFVARALNGIPEAITYSTIAAYIGEITTPSVREKWGSMLTYVLFCGQLTVTSVSACFDVPTTAYIMLIVPLIQISLVAFIPESPYFLIMKGKRDEAKEVLKKLRCKDNVDDEFLTLNRDVERQISESGSFKDLFYIPTNRKAITIAVGLRTFQQFSGVSAFLIYAQYTFQLAGAESISPEASSIAFYSVLFFLSVISSTIIGRYNRRTMLIISSIGCAISLSINALYFFLAEETEMDVSMFSWTPVMGMIFYVGSLTVGLSLLPTLMTGELYSASIKNCAMFVSTSYLALTVIVVPKVLQLLLDNSAMHVVFLFFALCCVLSAIFCFYCVPETKGKTLEQIQQLMSQQSYFFHTNGKPQGAREGTLVNVKKASHTSHV